MSIPTSRSETEANELMARHGIIRVPADQYHYKTFRYSSLDEAVAHARRDAPATGGVSGPTQT